MDTKKVCIRMKEDLIERLKIQAKLNKISFQKMLIEVIERGLIDIYRGGKNI